MTKADQLEAAEKYAATIRYDDIPIDVRPAFLAGIEFALSNRGLSREDILHTINEWKFFWMNQKQNSEADYQNYFQRAFGVDSNMKHNLADRLFDRLTNQKEQVGG